MNNIGSPKHISASNTCLRFLSDAVRTDITPHDRNDRIPVPPYKRIHDEDNIGGKEPRDDREGGNVARAPVSGQGREERKGGDEGDGGEFGVHDGQQRSGGQWWIIDPINFEDTWYFGYSRCFGWNAPRLLDGRSGLGCVSQIPQKLHTLKHVDPYSKREETLYDKIATALNWF
ncbi:hypothetical protein K438DRAFT_1775404 [Mycena galopus ATCC 62051]|nr:hypothetical protein K438DRAFT_1775404 [Mycena galopus ATCC 62051]